MGKNINQVLIPQVTKVPGQKKVDVSNKLDKTSKSDFKKLLEQQVSSTPEGHGLRLSHHASKRINERNLNMDANEFMKIREGIDKLKEKGGQESLVVTENAAYIVDVNNNTVVTAIDKQGLSENVFTKIDSTVFIN